MEKNPNFHHEVILTEKGKGKYSLFSQGIIQFYAKYREHCDLSLLLGVSIINVKKYHSLILYSGIH